MPAFSSQRLRALVLAAVLSPGIGFDAAAIELPDDFRAAIEQGIANGRYQSVAVALLDREEKSEWLLGEVEQGGAKPAATDAYEIGSTTRTFTGLLLAKALLDGKLRLDEPLGKIFSDVKFADRRLAAATIGEIATHRAGLPAVPSNLFPRNLDDPYVEYDAAALRAYLAHASLDKDVGTYRYSDLGVALLGEALARAYRQDYRTLMASQVLVPLGLTGSGFGQVKNLLDGHRNGEPAAAWQQQALAPAAGLRSTLADLSRFAAAELRPDTSTLRAAILLAREPRAVAGGGETTLAWQSVPVQSDGQNWPLLWQAGMTGGFSSFVGFRTDRQRAIVLLGNAGIDLSALGLTILADRHAPTAPPKLLPLVAPATLVYAGLYRFDSGADLVVRSTADGLTAQITGLLPQPMEAYDEDAFELGNENSQLTFWREQSTIVGAIVHRNGAHVRALRLSEGAPTLKRNASPLGADALRPYGGDYALSPSVRARVVVAPPGLRVQLTGRAPTFVQSCAADRFCDADGTLEIGFVRESGKVTALDWRQGVFEAYATRDDW
ncbi:MAG TPA: serine hydrolase domain-containing protein [Rhodanobacteraceae bacterium]|nr:serine hydrolase domain-containing protein [Rhodanobacteraceae bacterium]